MKKQAVALQVSRASLCGIGLMLAMIFPLAEPVLGDGFPEASTDGIQSKGSSENQTTPPPGGDKTEDSLLIGGGVRTPPDIGASGTSSSTPPVRTESPTDEPQIFPDVSHVPTHPSDPESAPGKESEPLGQPNHFKTMPEK